MQTLYDPPSGWRYGFPRPYEPTDDETLEQTLIRDGYPAAMAEMGARYCRFIGDWPANDNAVDEVARSSVEGCRRGDWMQTYTGRAVYPMDLRREDICIVDIAHALSMQCRYNGHSLRFYSVAEHSVLIARWLRDRHGDAVALEGLLHDAAEAYLADVPRPVKPFLVGYKEAEATANLAIAERYGLETNGCAAVHHLVHDVDNRILQDERIQNMANSKKEWSITDVPLGVTLQFWTPERAKAEFLSLFDKLYEGGGRGKRH